MKSQGCVEMGGTKHAKWLRPCGQHTARIPRHTVLSPGVCRDTVNRLECLPEGWLQ